MKHEWKIMRQRNIAFYQRLHGSEKKSGPKFWEYLYSAKRGNNQTLFSRYRFFFKYMAPKDYSQSLIKTCISSHGTSSCES